MKAAIYARVSTDKQTHDSQLNELREYCTRRNWQNVAEYCDTISGSKFSREGLDRLLTDESMWSSASNLIGLAAACPTWRRSSEN